MVESGQQAYETVVGLEIHAQLKTDTKIFCGCSTAFGGKANHQTCPICLGLPGVLPLLNERAVDFAIKAALATGCSIQPRSIFARKNYFYPDLPKGYQISQFEHPLALDGELWIPHSESQEATELMKVGITRIHMEEDAGKLLHDSLGQAADKSLVDFNRAGVPLIEIVSEPDLRSGFQAAEYARTWRQIVRYLGICDGNLEEGSMRCDANVSVRPSGDSELYTKVEIKNINSFKNVQRAIEYEARRQISAREAGENIAAETRLWDAARGVTRTMRSKEDAQDYRYFPEPDLIPLNVDEQRIARLRDSLPELPGEKRDRLRTSYGLSFYDSNFLIQDVNLAGYFEETVQAMGENHKSAKEAVNWLMSEFTRLMNQGALKVDEVQVQPKQLAELLLLIRKKVISGTIAKEVFEAMFESGQSAEAIVEARGLRQISDDSAIEQFINQVLEEHTKEVEEYRSGKEKLFGFFVGQVMKKSRGKANPGVVNDILKKRLHG